MSDLSLVERVIWAMAFAQDVSGAGRSYAAVKAGRAVLAFRSLSERDVRGACAVDDNPEAIWTILLAARGR